MTTFPGACTGHAERIAALETILRRVASQRIAECRRIEARGIGAGRVVSQAAIESWTERQTWQRVIAILDGEEQP